MAVRLTCDIVLVILSLTILTNCCGQSAEAGKKYALVVGVERYDPSQLASLQYAEDDAIELSKALTRLGFDVVTMTKQAEIPDRVPASATDILQQVNRRLRNRSKDDVIVVALSGHGVQLKSDKIRADGAKESYFCPERADLKKQSSLVAMSDVVSAMQKCKAGRKLLLVDACRNEISPKDLANKDASPIELELDPAGVTRRTIPKGMLALFSCSPSEQSFEFGSLKHSVFTHNVLQYLNGKAPATQYPRGELRISELVAFVTRETRDFIDSELGKDQNPELVLPDERLIDWEFGSVELALPVVFTSPSTGMQFKEISEGTFMMGSPQHEVGRLESDRPLQQVSISQPFYIGMYEVTQHQWKAVMKTSPWMGKEYVKGGDNFPATFVSHDDATEFCRRLSTMDNWKYRLPTEEEWEYACRAGTTTRFHFGDSVESMDDFAWWGGFGEGSARDNRFAHEVGLKKPNLLGLFDMHGNVYEWCSGSGVLRGGSWSRLSVLARSASRRESRPDLSDSDIGLRIVCDPQGN